MRFAWIMGMALSGLSILLFSSPGVSLALILMTLGIALPVSYLLMNLWMLLLVLLPAFVFPLSLQKIGGVLVALAIGGAFMQDDAARIEEARARLIPEQGPELGTFAQPPRSIEIVARDWEAIGTIHSETKFICGPTCGALLSHGTIDWLRLRLDTHRTRADSGTYVIERVPGEECAARLPGYNLAEPCLSFRQDDGRQADLVIEVDVDRRDQNASALVRALGMQRTIITDTRPGGGVVHDRTNGSWDVASSPFFLVPNADIARQDHQIKRMTSTYRLTAPSALEVLAKVGLAPVLSKAPPINEVWEAAEWRAGLMASAHDLLAEGGDRDDELYSDLAIYFQRALFDRPLADHEVLLRWKLATSPVTRTRVQRPHMEEKRRAEIAPRDELLIAALDNPAFGMKSELATELKSRTGPLAVARSIALLDVGAIRAALPTMRLSQRAQILRDACTAPPALREQNTLVVQAVIEQMIVEFPVRATGPMTTGSFDDTFRFGLRVLRRFDRPDLVESIRAQMDWDNILNRPNFSGSPNWSLEKIQSLYFDAPDRDDCQP
jgi:hypothetical protein